MEIRLKKEKLDFNGKSGNFLAMLKLLSKQNEPLKKHLESPYARNATYLSPKIQNDVNWSVFYPSIHPG